MVRRLNGQDPNFEQAFKELQARGGGADPEGLSEAVSTMIRDVRSRGTDALLDGIAQFDRFNARSKGLLITVEERDAAANQVSDAVMEALRAAADRIRSFHEKQMPEGLDYRDAGGTRLGQRWLPLAAAGLYVPGGQAAYPSSVLMNAIPAAVAGVDRLVMTTPTPDGTLNPLVMAAARLSGVTEIYRVGGAHAVAALAYGAGAIAPVDKVVGPGNAYVAEAKRQVFGQVGIDSIAGPSEILVIADAGSRPDWVAADLLSQAEHDRDAQSILITNDAAFADAVEAAVDATLKTLPRADIAGTSWRDNGGIIVVETLDEAVTLANRIAPEHLELAVETPEPLFDQVRHAGAVFLGRYTPEALGDYVAGPNHVLPTSGTARYASGLSVYDFMKRTTFVEAGPKDFDLIGPSAVALAHEEGLQAHALSVEIRLQQLVKGDD